MFSVSTLTIGDVSIVLRPVLSSAQLRETLDAISSIRGIDHASIDRLHGDTAHVRAHTDRPVALASELRSALRRRVLSCTVADGRFTVELATPGRPAPGVDPRDAGAADAPPVDADPRRDAPAPPFEGDEAHAARAMEAATAEALGQCTDLSVLLFDRDRRFTAAAGGLHRQIGQEFALLQGRPAEDVVPAGVWWMVRPGFVDALAGRARTVDVPLPSGLGTYEAAFRPLARDGRVVGGMVVVRDVTRRRATERALAESTAVLTAVLDESDTPFGLLAPSGRWARVNRALSGLLGEDEVGLLTSNLFDRIAPVDATALAEALDAMREHRIDRHACRMRLRRGPGDPLVVRARLTAVRAATVLQGVVVELRVEEHPSC